MLLLADLRCAFRGLWRNPGFAAIVIAVLAVGVGVNTAMFSIVDGILLRPLAFKDPSRLVAIQERALHGGEGSTSPVNAMHFMEWRDNWHSAEQLALLASYSMNLTSRGEPESVTVGRVSWNLFPMLGVQLPLGRNFRKEEDRPGSENEIILSDSIWQRRFHGDAAVLGSKVVLDGTPFEVIGVLPPDVQIPKVSQLQSMAFGSQSPEIWRPFALRDDEKYPIGDFDFACIARLKPEVSLVQASAELDAIQRDFSRRYIGNISLGAIVTPLQEQITGGSRQGLLLLLLAVGAVLLIVCVNVANLILVRTAGRGREFAIRAAIGASSGRLLRQTLTESSLIAALGGAFGLILAAATLRFVVANAPADLPRLSELHIDNRLLAIAFALSLVSALLCGTLPAWLSSRVDPQEGLRGGRTTTDSAGGRRFRSLLVSLEMALCTVCLVAAGLLLNSFVRVVRVDKGFDSERVITVDLNMPASRYPDTRQRSEFLGKTIDAAAAVPGVSTVGVSNLIPLSGEGNNNIINVDGDTTPFLQRPIADFRLINPDFFRAMGITIQRGRSIELSDRTHPVSVISASMAQRLWPNDNPLGKHFHLGDPNGPNLEVVGVAGDVRGASLQKSPNPTVYLPYWQRNRAGMSLIVRTAIPPDSIAASVRTAIHQLDSEMPVPEFRTLAEIVSASVAQRRFQLTLVLVFAGIALVLAGLGIYGVVSYSVLQRRKEMGVRMALGASGSQMQTLILRQGLSPVLIGLSAGLLGALAIGRVLSSLLFGVTATDPWTLTAATSVLLIVAACACYVPALRAMHSDPLIALRHE